MKKNPSEYLLEKTIKDHFEHISIERVDRSAHDYSEVITEMFEIKRIEGAHIELGFFFEEKNLYPVVTWQKLTEHLLLGQTFLITVGLKQGYWHILYMSPPYRDGPDAEDFDPNIN